ncbi:MAG: hypothetical protein ACQEVA_17500 [Myxococcota bacterium]
MQKLTGALLIGVLFALLYVGYLTYQRATTTKAQSDRIQVEDGMPTFETDNAALDMDSRKPLVKCYPVASTDQFDINQRMDFETRTSKGWVHAPRKSGDGEFCIEETASAVQKRLADQ